MNSKQDVFLKPRVQVSYLKIKDVLKPLYEGLNFIGRKRDATVIIENQNVSQHHAVITITDDKHYISDIGSFNGSFLDKNKLQPLLLYELTEGSIIHFACVTAIYVKTPSNSQAVFAKPQKASQNLSESFFVAQTQQLEVEGVEEVFNNCFDDDYDFNDVPTTENVSTIMSIHDMPTQIFSSSHIESIENSIHSIPTQINTPQSKLSSIHEMPTQLMLSESNIENEISITSTSMHELPTQIIDLDRDLDLIASKKVKEIEIHELPTQINCPDETSPQKPPQDKQIEICSSLHENEDNSVKTIQEQNSLVNPDKNEDILCRPNTSEGLDNNARNIDDSTITSLEPDINNKNEDILCQPSTSKESDNNADNIDDCAIAPIESDTNNKKEDILCRPSTSKCLDNNGDEIIDDDCVIGSPVPEHSAVNISDDIIDDSFLGNVSEGGGNPEYLLLKSISKLTNLESASLQISQPVGLSTKKKQCQPIVYSTSGSEKDNSPMSEDIIVAGQTKNCLRINSDSDTDIDDLLPPLNCEKTNDAKNDKVDDSGSATDIEGNLNVIVAATTRKVLRKRKKCRKIDSDSETDLENSNIEKYDSDTDMEDIPKASTDSPNKMSLKKKSEDFNIINSDSDTDIEKNETQVVDLGAKINVREEQDSDIIPCTQLSDDDVDDFNFGIQKNDPIETVEKNNLDDVSENFSLRFSSYTELSEEANNSKKIGVSVSTNEIHPNICADGSKNEVLIIDKIESAATKSTSLPTLTLATTNTLISNDLLTQPIQKIIPHSKDDSDNLFARPTEKQPDNVFEKSSSSKHRLDQPTQPLPLDVVCDDDLFMQPTQKLIQTSKDEVEHLFSCPTRPTRKPRSSSESLFDQPTQPLVSDDKCDDLFMQPTQKVVLTSKAGTENLYSCPTPHAGKTRSSLENLFDEPTQLLVNNEKCDDDLFMQPTQKLTHNSKSQIENQGLFDHPTQPLSLDDKVDDLFLQPTQKLTEENENLFDHPTEVITFNENNEEDLFLQPTQQIISTLDKQKEKENLFDQPTQPLTIEEHINDDNGNDCDDFFLVPTQKIVSPAKKAKKNEHMFDQPTQPLTLETNLDDDLFLQPTQQITSPNAVTLKSNSPLKVFSDNSEKGMSVESQLEVMFASQPLLPQSNSRPSNPLVSILEGNYTIDSQDVVSDNLPASELAEQCDVDQNEVTVTENLSSKQDVVTTKKQTRSREKVVVKKNVTVDNENNLTSKEESKSNKQLRNDRRPSLDDDKMLARRSQRIDNAKGSQEIEKQEIKVNKQRKKEKEGSTLKKTEQPKQSNEDIEEEVTVKENLSSKQGEVKTKKQTRSREKVAVKETIIVDNKDNLASKEENTLNKRLRNNRRLSLDDAKVENDKISTRRCRRIESSERIEEREVKVNKQNEKGGSPDNAKVENDKISTRRYRRIESSERIEEREVKVNKQNEKGDSPGGRLKKIELSKPSTEDKNEIGRKNIENERLKVEENKQRKTRDGNNSQETKIAVETKMNTRKRTTRADSVDSLNEAKTVKKSKTNDKCESPDRTSPIKSSSRLRNLKKDTKKLNKIEDAVPSKEVITSDVVKSSAVTKSEVSTITRSTRGSKKNANSEQPLAEANLTVISISSDNSDDDIILNKPRSSKRKQDSQASSSSPKKIKSSDTLPISTPIAKRSRRMLSKTDTVEEPVNQKRGNESDTSNANSSDQSLQTSIRNQRLSSVSSINDTPNRNKRKQKPKVVFTMLDSPELESLIRSLGGTIVDTVNACTVLVTGSLKRSQKLLSAVGQAKPICSVKWLQECKKMSTFLDPWDFILEDREAETKWNFSLKESLIRSQNKKLLQNYCILILVTTAIDVLKAAIECCGGKCVSRAPSDTTNFIVVASPENKKKYAKFIKQKVTIVSPEAIFDGVLRQELHFEKHLLS